MRFPVCWLNLSDLLSNVVKQPHPRPNHDGVRDGVDLTVHHELLLSCQLHEDHSEVGATQI